MDHVAKDRAQRQFDWWSKTYDRSPLQWLFFRPSHDAVLEELQHHKPGGRILDLGCGTGQLVERILEVYPTCQVVGLDLSEPMLERARRRCVRFGRRAQFVLGDSENLPFPTGSIDVVTCVHSFHHYPRQGKVLHEVARVLRGDGTAILIDGNRDGLWGWLVFDQVVTRIEGMVHHCSAAEFRQQFEAAGLGQVRFLARGRIAPFLVVTAERSSTRVQATGQAA